MPFCDGLKGFLPSNKMFCLETYQGSECLHWHYFCLVKHNFHNFEQCKQICLARLDKKGQKARVKNGGMLTTQPTAFHRVKWISVISKISEACVDFDWQLRTALIRFPLKGLHFLDTSNLPIARKVKIEEMENGERVSGNLYRENEDEGTIFWVC